MVVVFRDSVEGEVVPLLDGVLLVVEIEGDVPLVNVKQEKYKN